MQGNILVPLDGLPLAQTALPMASYLAAALHVGLEFLRVLPAEAPREAAADARTYLDQLAAESREPVTTRVMRGEPGPCIVREVDAEATGLVVMATHARAGLSRAVLGSVAEYVVAHASAPVVLIPPLSARKPVVHTLLVAMDRTAAAPLTKVKDFARTVGAHVVLLSVVPPEETAIWQWQRGPLLDEPQVVVTARKQLEDLVNGFAQAGISAEARVVVGSPSRMIDAVADRMDADLIVMSTHARTGAARTLSGSVTDAVVHAGKRPVLVCRLITPPPAEVRQIDLFHAMQRRAPRSAPTPIVGPLDVLRPR